MMLSLPVYDMNKNKVGTIEVDDTLFSAEVLPHLLNDAVRTQIAKRFEWKTANSRTRTEVHGTRKKMYKQKGTGQARHGDAKAPIFVGGGKSHGPKPRLVVKKLNKKTMRKALISALSQSQKLDRLFIVDKLELPKPNTKTAATCMNTFGLTTALFVNQDKTSTEQFFNLSTRNLPTAKLIKPEGVNVFDVLKYKNLVFSKSAVQTLSEKLRHV